MGNYAVELCPIVNEGKAISRSVESLPSVRGYEVPLMPTSCDLVPFDGWEIPLMPTGGCPYPIVDITWNQGTVCHFTSLGTTIEPADKWVFCCTPPQGLFEGKCSRCFPKAAAVRLVGSLGFSADAEISHGQQISWVVEREDLPLPGESLIAIVAVFPGGGDALLMKGSCAAPKCDTPGSDCMWNRQISLQTSGYFLPIASTFFATPTWTGGTLVDYYTEGSGWANIPSGNLSFPNCDVYGDPTLKYSVFVEGVFRTVTSLGFAGYGIGTHVFLKKLGMVHNEPFSDSCLGVDEGSPAKVISNEKIGVSIPDSLTPFSPPLTQLSTLPIDLNSPITVVTSYDVRGNTGWITKPMIVNVDSNGLCSGDCLVYEPGNPQGEGGLLNVVTGEWTRDIVWKNIPNADRYNDVNIEAVIQILCTYTKAEEACTSVVVLPWHIMGMGG